jgi:hypothetical protein
MTSIARHNPSLPTPLQQRASGQQPPSTPTQAKPSALPAPRDGFESKFSKASKQGDVQSLFREQFGALATDKKQFHEKMRGIFGEGYDSAKAEQYRQQALSGDFEWLPPVKWVEPEVLGEGYGAYDAGSGTVLLNRALQDNPSLAASTYVEEAGHHLDAQLNTQDTQGDEGELFRRILNGEKLTPAQVKELRAENDKGIIQLNGQAIEVEFRKRRFRNAMKKLGNGIKKVAKGAVDTVKKAGKAVVNSVKEAGKAVVAVAKGVAGGVKSFITGVSEGVTGFVSNLVKGKVADAFQSLARGADKAFLQAPMRVLGGVVNSAQRLANSGTALMGPLAKPARSLTARAFDATRTTLDTGSGIVRDVLRTASEVPVAFLRGAEKAVKQAAKGEWGAAVGSLGKGVKDAGIRLAGGAVDVFARGVQGTLDTVLTLAFAEAPARGLSDSEVKLLKQVYGDSVDYSAIRLKRGGSTDWTRMAPHVVGNTVYMPTHWNKEAQFNRDGSFTAAGLETLLHEVGHVWQNQNGGGDYIHRALLAQVQASRESGSRSGAYDWRGAVAQGKSFEELNPEQQAHLMEDLGMRLLDGNSANDWSAEELSFAISAWRKVKQGEGSR